MRAVLEKIKTVNVSHRVRRGVSGALHEETVYGAVHDRKTQQPVPGEFVMRKPVESLTMNEVEKIRDDAIRHIVIKRLGEHGIKAGRGADQVTPKKMAEAVKDLKMPSGVPIRKVRVVKPDLTIQPIREGTDAQAFVKPGSTHHLCIFEWEEKDRKGKPKRVRDAVFVTMLEARQRIKRGEEIIQRTHPEKPEANFVMSLSGGELVLAKVRGKDEPVMMVFKTAASTSKQMQFALSTDARRSGDQTPTSFAPSTLNAEKVTVDPLGRVRWAND